MKDKLRALLAPNVGHLDDKIPLTNGVWREKNTQNFRPQQFFMFPKFVSQEADLNV